MEQKYQKGGFHAQEKIAGLLKCENVQGKEHLIKRGEHNGNKKGDGYSAHNKSADI